MESEEIRLNTFSNWPSDAPIDAGRVARGGFYATGIEMEVECHWCKGKISDWHYGDQVMARHRRLNPTCSFVVNPTNSGNIIIESNQPTQSNSVEPVDLMNEQCRLATFRNWPISHVTPQSLAKAGFYYYNQSDRVSCAWCHGVIAEWEIGDNPFTEHQRFFPDCPRAQLGPNVEIATEDGIRVLGIQPLRTPKEEKYSCLDARIRTFIQWPISDTQKPEILAKAGFYFLGNDDRVRCFHCSGGLRSWQKEDDPWFEHAKWFPKCQFVQLVKGDQYIKTVEQMTRPSLNDAMQSQPVRQALQMGLHVGRIRAVTKNHLEEFGKPYISVEALVEAVLDSQFEENANGDDDEQQSSSKIVQEVSRILDTIFTPRPSSSVTSSIGISENVIQSTNNHKEKSTDNQSTTTTQNKVSSSSTTLATKHSLPNSNDSNNRLLQTENPTNSCASSLADHHSQPLTALEEENRQLKDARLCKICMGDEVGVVFLPCGHLVTCVQCAPSVSACPLCRGAIKGFVRTFLS